MRWKQRQTCIFASQFIGIHPPPTMHPPPLLPEDTHCCVTFSKWAALHLLILQVQSFYFSSLTLLVPALCLPTQRPCRTSSSSSSSFSYSSSCSSSSHTSRTQAFQHCFALPRKRQIKQGCRGETPPAPPSVFFIYYIFWEAVFAIAGCATGAATHWKREMRSFFFLESGAV